MHNKKEEVLKKRLEIIDRKLENVENKATSQSVSKHRAASVCKTFLTQASHLNVLQLV